MNKNLHIPISFETEEAALIVVDATYKLATEIVNSDHDELKTALENTRVDPEKYRDAAHKIVRELENRARFAKPEMQ